ncbi:NUDIX domain-containing protein [Planotetraspora kaengkrachanensis]|uniref:DNA mismatch repair protein MutT n=1 Tax=Planotetraspora kaengkrachanensis TaxID=575193 RepID=A0A8J3PXJ9_9ACTN|nr:NUDIX domain-containing protein [Planotetraspora kaengkrachanensis]GIG82728.1 DNA mismatch repair protein MutT [Planotetraspora kaengkrachanensis]
MPVVHLRHSVRAIVLDEDDRILLCRHVIPKPTGTIVVWAAPGGGVEHGEAVLAALRRELHEEVGLTIDADPPHVWHQEVVGPGFAVGHDGVINDYFLVRAASFRPLGAMSDDELAAENIFAFRWWRLPDIAEYCGTDLFSPRDLATPLAALIAGGVPSRPLSLGL